MATETGIAEVNGARLYYEVAGEGHPLVLAHAGIADCRMWDTQFDTLSEHYRVIRYDMRGYGKTRPVAGEFSHYSDLYALLTHLGIDSVYLLGCSMGGSTVIDFALQHPQMVKGLIVVAGVPNGYVWEENPAPPPQWDAATAAFKAGDLEQVSELEVQIWIDGQQRTPDQVDPAIRDLVREMNLIALQHESAGLGEQQHLDPPAANRLAEIEAPVLFIAGDLDDPAIVAADRQLAAQIAGAEFALMAGTAHLPNMEQPETFNQHVLAFLQKLDNS